MTFRRTNPTLTKRSIAQLMTQRLLGSPYVALHDLRCDYCDGTLTLRGRVPTFHTKQVAISLAVQLEGVTAVVDRVEVVERPQNPATT